MPVAVRSVPPLPNNGSGTLLGRRERGGQRAVGVAGLLVGVEGGGFPLPRDHVGDTLRRPRRAALRQQERGPSLPNTLSTLLGKFRSRPTDSVDRSPRTDGTTAMPPPRRSSCRHCGGTGDLKSGYVDSRVWSPHPRTGHRVPTPPAVLALLRARQIPTHRRRSEAVVIRNQSPP